MDKAIFTVTIGDECEEIAQVTHPTMKAYAEKVGADFVVARERKNPDAPAYFEKWQVGPLLAKYRRVLLLDTDIVVREGAPNVFDLVPESCFGGYDEREFHSHEWVQVLMDIMKESIDWGSFGPPLCIPWEGSFVNAGMWVLSQGHRKLFGKPQLKDYNFHFPEQTWMSYLLWRDGIRVAKLSKDFNYMTTVNPYPVPSSVHMVHVIGNNPPNGDRIGTLRKSISRESGNG
jgi:hypothetical protein